MGKVWQLQHKCKIIHRRSRSHDGQVTLQVNVMSKSPNMSARPYLMKYRLNPSFNENLMAIKTILKKMTLPVNVISRSSQNHSTCRLDHKCCFVLYELNPYINEKVMAIKAKLKKIWSCRSRSYQGQGQTKITQHVGFVIIDGLSKY